MHVRYKKQRRRDPWFEEGAEQAPIAWWIDTTIAEGGIEDQLRKLRQLMAIIGEEWLAANPQRVAEVAQAIECSRHEHKITYSDP